MNRRTAIGTAAASLAVGLGGCIENLRELRLSTPVPIKIVNETDEPHNVLIEAFAAEDGRKTYDEGVNVKPDQRADLGHLDDEPQRLRVTLVDDDVTEEADIDEDTQSVRAVIVDGGLEIHLATRGESSDGPDGEEESDGR